MGEGGGVRRSITMGVLEKEEEACGCGVGVSGERGEVFYYFGPRGK